MNPGPCTLRQVEVFAPSFASGRGQPNAPGRRNAARDGEALLEFYVICYQQEPMYELASISTIAGRLCGLMAIF